MGGQKGSSASDSGTEKPKPKPKPKPAPVNNSTPNKWLGVASGQNLPISEGIELFRVNRVLHRHGSVLIVVLEGAR